MRIIAQISSRCIRNGFLTGGPFQAPYLIKPLSTRGRSGNLFKKGHSIEIEPVENFEQRIFGGSNGGNSQSESFFQKLDRLSKARDGPDSRPNERNSSEMGDGLDESLNTLEDGMDEKLQKAAEFFEEDDETSDEDYDYRPDARFSEGDTYDLQDLDLTKPFVRRPVKRAEFHVTTEEALSKADFRNVRFLANFITEAGIIIKRSKTGISAKAQRKVAREIKTARAFGLMPFTTMGTKSFVFGRSMENLNDDFQYQSFDRSVDDGKD
ncbi:unnamed protein product [Dovyalis caffra]|uniref:Small ribosomal subunit protein bS18c n=1 Tax=Dovyalis caffra TaxID=77055 RepID=A0AAV1S4Y5_9ROSI|nr:unnamed protein product [Dovyalis caffra]